MGIVKNTGESFKALGDSIIDFDRNLVGLVTAVRGLGKMITPIYHYYRKKERLEREISVLRFNRFWFGITYTETMRLSDINYELISHTFIIEI